MVVIVQRAIRDVIVFPVELCALRSRRIVCSAADPDLPSAATLPSP
ncbi:hypothetical protein AAAT94_14520 [Intestinimonas aquisgranensis]